MPIVSYDQKPIVSPFKGIVSSNPKPYTPPNSFDDILNYFLYRGRIISRNKSVAYSTAPDASNIYNLIPFSDILGNLHNLILTAKAAYMLTSGPTWNGPLLLPAWSASPTYAVNDMGELGRRHLQFDSGRRQPQSRLEPHVLGADQWRPREHRPTV
jgi:hypothetical protein